MSQKPYPLPDMDNSVNEPAGSDVLLDESAELQPLTSASGKTNEMP